MERFQQFKIQIVIKDKEKLFDFMITRASEDKKSPLRLEPHEELAAGHEGQDSYSKEITHGKDKRPAQEHCPNRTFTIPEL